jgi:chlorinating enzyme
MTQSSLAAANRSSAARTAPLRPEQVERYDRDGYVVPDFRLSEEETGRLRALLYRLVEENPRWASHTNSPHVPGSGTMGVKSFPGWMEFCEHPAILDMVEQLVGPDIILWGTSTFYKKASKGAATPWHRDTVNMMISPPAATLVWIAATEARIDNGCLRFISGSNNSPTVGEHHEWKIDTADGYESGIEIDRKEYDANKAVDVELEPGQMVIFNAHTIHGSRPNQGTRDRASFTLRYMPGTSKFGHEGVPERERGYHAFHLRPLILVRGKDSAGNDFRRGHPGLDPNLEAEQLRVCEAREQAKKH